MTSAVLEKPETFTPSSEEDCAALFKNAESTLPFAVVGGGTRAVGKVLDVPHHTLSTAGLSGIVDYEPAEMVMIARAGTPMAQINAALEEGRQRMIFEPMDLRPLLGTKGQNTIGGVVATNASGPRRFVAGAARDSMLGIRFVNGKGDVIKTGGRVMKNVTGLDLVKLLTGSWGTLGVMTEVTFKVVPVVETERTLILHGLSDADAAAMMAKAMATSCEVSGAAHLPANIAGRLGATAGQAATLLRLEGFASSVDLRAKKLKDLLDHTGEISEQDASASRQMWRDIRDVEPFADATQTPVWRVSVAPMAGHRLVQELTTRLGEIDAFYDWQGGLVWLRLNAGAEADAVRSAVAKVGGGHATLMRASEAVRAETAIFQTEDPAVKTLSEAVRMKFDPFSRLNPGRMH
ncbi:MAG: FAD-binding protein [Pseudomonadota bacterium]